jgi:hypothetical protein
MAAVSNVPVYSEAQLEQAIMSYIAQGFVLANRTPTSAAMFKKKEFSILWAVVGLILCLLPLLIYLIVYAAQSDQMVQIYLADPASIPASAPAAAPGQLSPDGRWRWDGARWQPAQPAPLPAPSVKPAEPPQSGPPPA